MSHVSLSHDGYGPVPDGQWAALSHLLCQCFDIPGDTWELYVARSGREQFRGWWSGGHLVAGLAYLPFGQHFGGRSVKMAGLAVVGSAPEVRGTGQAAGLLRETLTELRGMGYPLSTLYPAVEQPYRKVGYEQAGSKTTWAVDLDRIRVEERDVAATPVPTDEAWPFAEVYSRFARQWDGTLDRAEHAWKRVLRPRGAMSYGYLLGPADAPEGYLVFRHLKGVDLRHDIEVLDFAALTPGALRRGWSLLASHRSLARVARWHGPANDPRLLVLPDQTARTEGRLDWMLRVLDPAAAVAARGWPAAAAGSVEIVLTDALFPENAGPWRLDVAAGEGRLERIPGAGAHAVRMDVRGFAALYSGYVSPHEAALVGLLAGSPAAVEAAERVFVRSRPWMSDHF